MQEGFFHLKSPLSLFDLTGIWLPMSMSVINQIVTQFSINPYSILYNFSINSVSVQ